MPTQEKTDKASFLMAAVDYIHKLQVSPETLSSIATTLSAAGCMFVACESLSEVMHAAVVLSFTGHA